MITVEKLNKIAEIARRGTGGERENARRILERECKARGISYNTVLNGNALIHDSEPSFTGFYHAYAPSYGSRQREDIYYSTDFAAEVMRKKRAQQAAKASEAVREEIRKAKEDLVKMWEQFAAEYAVPNMQHETYTFKDKGGISWTREEIDQLSMTKRFYLFGCDPLAK